MTLGENLVKADELQPDSREPVKAWLTACWNQGYRFSVVEVFRTQQRQDQLYLQGRTKPGRIVTWTRHSMHTLRLALDLVAENCTYQQLEDVGLPYAIYRPRELVRLGDKGHFQTDKCHLPIPTPPPRSSNTVISDLLALIAKASGPIKASLVRRLNAFKKNDTPS